MGKFPIVRAPEQLGVTPRTAVRADIDVRTGEGAVGQTIGQALLAGGQILFEIRRRRQEMTDANSSVRATKLRQIANAEFEAFKLTNPQETWESFRREQVGRVAEQVAGLQFSPNALIVEQTKSEAYGEVETAKALTDATHQLRTDTIDALTESLVDAFRSGDPKEIVEATKRYKANGDNMGKDKVEVLSDIKAAQKAGEILRSQDAIGAVHAAIEAASDPKIGTGNFEIAKELAKNPLIPEPQQTTLRNTISSAEKAVGTARAVQLKELQEQTAIRYSGRIAEIETSQDSISLMVDIDKDIANRTLDRKVGEGYKRELVRGREVPTDWNVNNRLVLDIEAIRDGKKDFIEVFNEIQTHRGQDLNGSEIDALTASARTAKSIAENKLPSITANSLKRYQRILTAYFNADMFGKRDKKNLAESSAKYADRAEQLDRFFTEEHTSKEAEDFFTELTKDVEGEGFLGRLWKYMGTVGSPTTLGFQIASDMQRQSLKEYSSPPIPIPKPTNQAEYDLIATGSEYIHPDGTKKVKQ